MSSTRSSELFERAQRVIPGGVNSPVRAFRAVGGDPRFIARGQGSKMWDVDGQMYIDYVGSWGPLILGHAHPSVVEAISRAAANGSSFGAPTEGEVQLAELITSRAPGVERVRLVSSGTEAAMSVLRVARGFTKRDAVVKLEGCYHGHADYLLTKAGSGVATFGLPDSPGVPADFAKHTLTVPYNDMTALEGLFAKRGSEIAALILEPVVGNMGLVPPDAGYLEAIRALTERHGALLVFDEVMTGFRVHPSGASGLFGVRPDLFAFGKVIGGGMPLAAYGGRADVMSLVAPAGPVYQAGTLSGNPCAVAAGLVTLELLGRPGTYERLEATSKAIADGLASALAEAGVGGRIQRVGSMMTLFFGDDRPVRSFEDAKAKDHGKFKAFFRGMLDRGVYLPPSGYEAFFVSLAHGEDDVKATIAAARDTLQTLG
ncbi:MAG: glutamate-1-semialdehyde 2,1-aminomutase [Deltaproteobacteria bacterium]|nr:glutamate-1-semialdehyde 2,1-aminomutase [Deltaproteobacteria bacterium]